ncbi:hypothetical protein GCM10011586_22300 [Silvibacterium dinghuense]|nr:hypothetical protein GCM10011586_22300 [Silvibacterium dinghuense]
MRIRISAVLLLLCLAGKGHGQAASPQGMSLRYETVSIRENSDANARTGMLENAPDMTALRMSLHDLVAYACQVRSELVFGGPAWSNSRHFDISAKVAASDTPELQKMKWRERGPLILPALTERFALKIHHETRTLPVYDLVVSPKGNKLKPTTIEKGDDTFKLNGGLVPSGSMVFYADYIRGIGVDMPTLARILSGQVDRVIVDHTGLTGVFNFAINTAEDPGNDAPSMERTSERPEQAIAIALHDQAGLELKPAREAVDVVVIDSATPPTPD